MNGQLVIDFDTATAARASDPETSREAAADRPTRATDRQRALDILRACPAGLTDFELGDLMGRQQTSAGKRRHELMTIGLVSFAGFWRPSPTGARARVWRAV